MSIEKVIESIERDAFDGCMNKPEKYVPSDSEIEVLQTIQEILKRGNTAEIKRKTDGSMTVYEVEKRKR